MIMMLKSVLDLKNSIEGYRERMYDLALNRGMNDPETIKISQELDQQIVSLQKIIAKINSLPA